MSDRQCRTRFAIRALFHVLAVVALSAVLTACRTAPGPGARAAAVPSELLQTSYLFEVVRYLYHWDLDEAEVERIETGKRLTLWIRRLEHSLDPGDRSVEGEILLPQLQTTVNVKKEDYTIEELGVAVKSPIFRITRITRDQVPAHMPRGCALVQIDAQDVRDYLFRTRDEHDYADQALVEHLRKALHEELARQGSVTNALTGGEIFHFAPLSPVANETWVLWEAGRKLFYVASDMDLANPAVWDHEALAVHVYDLEDQVVGSHEEAAGSSRFLTRDQVSRALFNCIVLGQQITVAP